MDEFCRQKGIKREYSVARTPQQNGVAERKNRTLIEVARTMLADSLLPMVFWAEAVNTACYVLNMVLVTKPHNKTPYELINCRAPSISFMRPFGCPVTILNTLDPLGKFDGKVEEGFLVGYSVNSKAFRKGMCLLNKSSDDKAKDYTVDDDACKKTVQEPISEYDQPLKNVLDKMMDQDKEAIEQSDAVRKEFEAQFNTASASMTFSPVGPSSGPSFVPFGGSFPIVVANLPHEPLMPELEDTAKIRSTGIFGDAYDDHDLETLNTPYADQSMGAEANFNNMEPSTIVSPIPTTRVHSIHPKAQIIRDPKSAVLAWTGNPQQECKKQTVVGNSTTEAKYIAATKCRGQVLWIQNQLLDYGYNFMQTKIYVDNESAICVVKNPVYHSKTKHIEIRNHFIRDSYKKRLIEMVKIRKDNNAANFLTKAFDLSRFNSLVESIGMLNL
ncbi:ribonuclease H-like domain-containing protein [Tanacetum coccineum]